MAGNGKKRPVFLGNFQINSIAMHAQKKNGMLFAGFGYYRRLFGAMDGNKRPCDY
jgi:hypothetical protein